MKTIGQLLWKLGKQPKLVIKIKNIDNFKNFISEMDLATFKTPSLMKESRQSDNYCGSQEKSKLKFKILKFLKKIYKI